MFIRRVFGRAQPQLPRNNRESIREGLFSVERLEEHAQPVVSGPFRGSPLAGRLAASCVRPLKDHAGAGIFDVDQRRRLSAIIELIRIFGSDRPAHKDVAKYGTSCGYSRYCQMIRFNVVKEQHGWAIRMDERMMTPFWSRDLAIREANCLARAIRCHGECAEVIVEGAVPSEPLTKTTDTRSAAA